jgi:hypothetical protein
MAVELCLEVLWGQVNGDMIRLVRWYHMLNYVSLMRLLSPRLHDEIRTGVAVSKNRRIKFPFNANLWASISVILTYLQRMLRVAYEDESQPSSSMHRHFCIIMAQRTSSNSFDDFRRDFLSLAVSAQIRCQDSSLPKDLIHGTLNTTSGVVISQVTKHESGRANRCQRIGNRFASNVGCRTMHAVLCFSTQYRWDAEGRLTVHPSQSYRQH